MIDDDKVVLSAKLTEQLLHVRMTTTMTSIVNTRKWYFDNYKVIKMIGVNRIAFQRKGKYTRGCTITVDGFDKMEDVSIVPSMKMELENNVVLSNQGKFIQLVKYCMTRDGKRCEGGLFNFILKEWQYYWNVLRVKIRKQLSE